MGKAIYRVDMREARRRSVSGNSPSRPSFSYKTTSTRRPGLRQPRSSPVWPRRGVGDAAGAHTQIIDREMTPAVNVTRMNDGCKCQVHHGR